MAMSQGQSGAAADAVPANPLDQMWYVQGKAVAEGPYKGHVLADMIKAGAVGPAANIALVGATQWTALVNVPALASQGAVVRLTRFSS